MALPREYEGFEDAINIVSELVSTSTGFPGAGSVAVWGIKALLKYFPIYTLKKVLNKKNVKALGIPDGKYSFVFEQTREALATIDSIDYNPLVFKKAIFTENRYSPTIIGAILVEDLHIDENSDVLKAVRFVIAVYLLHWVKEQDSSLEIIQQLQSLVFTTNKNLVEIDKLKRKQTNHELRIKNLEESRNVPISTNTITKEKIWAAGKQWYDCTRQDGHKFSQLYPNHYIFPNTSDSPIPISVSFDNQKTQGLMKALETLPSHCYLIGEGGGGKTTALYAIMEKEYKNNDKPTGKQIPLFVELSKAYNTKDFDRDNGISYFIRYSILRLLSIDTDNPKGPLNQLQHLFEQSTANKPEYLLLLDGLNEVSRGEIGLTRIDGEKASIISMVIAEIRYIMNNYQNVRIVLTSRSEDYSIKAPVTSLYLSGIKRGAIKNYLKEKISPDRYRRTIENDRLMNILRTPIFLVLYAKLHCDDEFLSRGEILHAYYLQKKNDYSEYDMNFTKPRELEEDSVISEPSRLNFILTFIFPEIAWHMAKKNEYEISSWEIDDIIVGILKDRLDTSICGKYGSACFQEYNNSESIDMIADSMINSLGGINNMNSVAYKVRDHLTLTLGLLRIREESKYEIVHQHFRDFFAAVYHINSLRLAFFLFSINPSLAKKCLTELIENPLPNQVARFIGEALGETHNLPKFDSRKMIWEYNVPDPDTNKCDRNLIKRVFGIFRGDFANNSWAVWNLFQILKLTRQDLSGENLSNLDLSNCRANGCRLVNSSFSAKLSNSVLNDKFFMPFGHSLGISSAAYSCNEKYIITGSKDGTVKIWDAKTLEELDTIRDNFYWINSAQFNQNETDILVASNNKYATIYSFDGYKHNKTGELKGHSDPIQFAQFNSNITSDNNRLIVTASADNSAKIWKWNGEYYSEFDTLKGHKSRVSFAQFNPRNEDIIVTASFDNTAKVWIWDGERYAEFETLSGHTDVVRTASFSSSGNLIVTTSDDNTAKIWKWDKNTSEYVEEDTLLGHSSTVLSAHFNPKAENQIVTASHDGSAKVWLKENEKYVLLGSLNNHQKSVTSAVFSPHGKYILTSSNDGTAKIWDAKTYEEIGEIPKALSSDCSIFEVTTTDTGSFQSFPGLNLWGLDIHDIDESSQINILTELKRNGAIVKENEFRLQVIVPTRGNESQLVQLILSIEMNKELQRETDYSQSPGWPYNSKIWEEKTNRYLITRYLSNTHLVEFERIIKEWMQHIAKNEEELKNVNLSSLLVQSELSKDLNNRLSSIGAIVKLKKLTYTRMIHRRVLDQS